MFVAPAAHYDGLEEDECEGSLSRRPGRLGSPRFYAWGMPELPEVEITARRLSSALEGAEVESALATGVATLKTFEPSLDALTGARIEGVRRIGKMLAVDFDTSPQNGGEPLTLLIHLMSAGRLQLFDKRASLK